jgi:hypothetical protein
MEEEMWLQLAEQDERRNDLQKIIEMAANARAADADDWRILDRIEKHKLELNPETGQDVSTAHNTESQKDRAVEMSLRLNMDFQAAGKEGSNQRRIFIEDLKQDLADASGMGTSAFNILNVSPGSVIVDINAPEKAAQEIHRQSLDPNSRLRLGKFTRFTDKVTLPGPVENSSPFEGGGEVYASSTEGAAEAKIKEIHLAAVPSKASPVADAASKRMAEMLHNGEDAESGMPAKGAEIDDLKKRMTESNTLDKKNEAEMQVKDSSTAAAQIDFEQDLQQELMVTKMNKTQVRKFQHPSALPPTNVEQRQKYSMPDLQLARVEGASSGRANFCDGLNERFKELAAVCVLCVCLCVCVEVCLFVCVCVCVCVCV